MNTLVILCAEAKAQDEKLKDADYRGIIWFTGMDDKAQALKADIRWKMNNLPFTQRKDRYLVANVTFKPGLENTGLDMHIETVQVPGKTVSEGFIHQLQNWPWLNLVKLKPEFAELLKRVTSTQVMPDQTLVLEAKPAPPAK
jgi:hypothetical protein